MRQRPTPDRIAEIRDWVNNVLPDGVQEAHVLEMARDLLAELDSRNPHIWHVFSCRVGYRPCTCAGRWINGPYRELVRGEKQ